MRKLFAIAFYAVFAGLVLTACGGDGEGDSTDGDVSIVDEATSTSSSTSAYYNDIVFAQGGEFLGLNIGDSRTDVSGKLPADGFDDETESYMYYYWLLDNNDYYLDLYFESDKLNSIDGYVYFYDDESYYDNDAAKAFYADLKADFVAKYGEAEEETDGEYTYTYWYFDDKDVEVGMDEGEVYWYIYSYEDYSAEEEVETTDEEA